jgi:ribulose 1,5-bisphosphate synthetase/thiazole synthase
MLDRNDIPNFFETLRFDLVVIGGGSGGLVAAKRAASHAARVTFPEDRMRVGHSVHFDDDTLNGVVLVRDSAQEIIPVRRPSRRARRQIASECGDRHSSELCGGTPMAMTRSHRNLGVHDVRAYQSRSTQERSVVVRHADRRV